MKTERDQRQQPPFLLFRIVAEVGHEPKEWPHMADWQRLADKLTGTVPTFFFSVRWIADKPVGEFAFCFTGPVDRCAAQSASVFESVSRTVRNVLAAFSGHLRIIAKVRAPNGKRWVAVGTWSDK